MRQAIEAGVIWAAVTAALALASAFAGFSSAYLSGYTATVTGALVLAAVFARVWWRTHTALALGMAFSWAGTAALQGYWLAVNIFDVEYLRTSWLIVVPVGLYLTGIATHLRALEGEAPAKGLTVAVMALQALAIMVMVGLSW